LRAHTTSRKAGRAGNLLSIVIVRRNTRSSRWLTPPPRNPCLAASISRTHSQCQRQVG
jgi:hypothetical protein